MAVDGIAMLQIDLKVSHLRHLKTHKTAQRQTMARRCSATDRPQRRFDRNINGYFLTNKIIQTMSKQIFNYQGNDITFDFGNEQKMVNATQMGKTFGKRPKEFLRLDQTKLFIEVLSQRANMPLDQIIRKVRGGRNHGTWMHEKLALEFSRWLSPEFSIWCNEKIFELLTTGKATIQQPVPLSEDEILARAYQIQTKRLNAAQSTIDTQKPVVRYANEVLSAKNTYTTTKVAAELGLSAVALNRKLKAMGIHRRHGGQWLLFAKYQGNGYTKTKSYTRLGGDGNYKVENLTVWTEKGRRFIHELINPDL